MRESEKQCFLDTRALKQASHQSKSLTKASKSPNQKYLRLVEVPRAESLVDEVVGALLTCVAEERVEVGGLEGVWERERERDSDAVDGVGFRALQRRDQLLRGAGSRRRLRRRGTQ